MAQEEDVLLYAGVLPDLASAEKAGKELRATLEKQLYGFAADIGKHVHSTDELYSSIAKFGKSTGGMSTLYTAGNVRRAMQRLVLTDVDASTRYGASNKIVEAVSDIRAVENAIRRIAFNDPVNQAIADVRKRNRVDAALKEIGGGVDDGFVREYKKAKARGDTATLARLDKQLAIKSRAANVILGAPELVTDEQYGAASGVKRLERALNSNTKAVGSLATVVTSITATTAQMVAQALPTYWHETTTRGTFASLQAQAQRQRIYGAGAGEIAGNIIGGVLGAALTRSPAGAAAGSLWLGKVGSSIGELLGQYSQERLESTQRTIAQINAKYKAYGIYGNRFSTGYAAAVQETGTASASDVENMTHNAATLGARMMFGQVGENEMLMYSLMPEYFAAAMSGASDAELAEAFSRSLDKLPPNLRVWAAESVGGGSLGMLAYTNSPTFGYIQRNAGLFHAQDIAQMAAGAGFHTQSAVRGFMDRTKETGAVFTDVAYAMNHQQAGLWSPEGTAAENAILYNAGTKSYATPKYASYIYGLAGRLISDIVEGRSSAGMVNRVAGRVLQTINVNIDGETVKSQDNTITEEELSGVSPTLTYTLGV